jgi:putative hydrolase of the HAD superfamily
VPSIAAQPIELILFDVGGVLVELGGVSTFLGWLGHPMTAAELWPLWLRSSAVRAFETGRTDAQQFAHDVLAEMGLTSIDPQRFLESFAAWPTGLYPGALELAASVPPRCRRALLSNSNVLHWPRVLDEMGLGAVFEEHFASHLMGRIKPDAECFEFVLQQLRCPAASVLFLDDNLLNVEAARALGMQARLVRGPQQAALALQESGILTAAPELRA